MDRLNTTSDATGSTNCCYLLRMLFLSKELLSYGKINKTINMNSNAFMKLVVLVFYSLLAS